MSDLGAHIRAEFNAFPAPLSWGVSADRRYALILDASGELLARVTHDAYAAEIVAAVNALPALADLVEAVGPHPETRTDEGLNPRGFCAKCGRRSPCPTARALDALAAALGVTQ